MSDSDKRPQSAPASMSGASGLSRPIVPDVVVETPSTARPRSSSWSNQFVLGRPIPEDHKGLDPSVFHN
jgi:hypothetical protein